MVRRATAAHTRMLLGLLNPGSNPTPFTAPSKRAAPGPGLEGRGFAACSFSSQNLLFTDGQRAAELREPGGPRLGAGRGREGPGPCLSRVESARSFEGRPPSAEVVGTVSNSTTAAPFLSRRRGIFGRPTTSKPQTCLLFEATSLAALGDLLETSSALASPAPGGLPPSRGHAWPQNACHFSTVSQGPFARSLSARSAGGRTQAPARCPRRPSPLGVQEHHTPAGQPSPAALTRFSGRLQATRRPTVARRPATRARLPAPEVAAPGSHPAAPAAPSPPRGHPPARLSSLPACPPPDTSFLTLRSWKFMSPALQPLRVELRNGSGPQALPKGRVACRKVL